MRQRFKSLQQRFTQPGTHEPFSEYTYAEDPPPDETAQPRSLFRNDFGDLPILIETLLGHQCDARLLIPPIRVDEREREILLRFESAKWNEKGRGIGPTVGEARIEHGTQAHKLLRPFTKDVKT